MQDINIDFKTNLDNFFSYFQYGSYTPEDLEKEYNLLNNHQRYLCKVTVLNGNISFEGTELDKRGRYKPTKEFLEELNKRHILPNVCFLINLGDGDGSGFPQFGVIKETKNIIGNIPFPVGNLNRSFPGTASPLVGWDRFIEEIRLIGNKYPWENKIPKACFRGLFAMKRWAIGEHKKVVATKWSETLRGKMFTITSTRPDIFDVGFHRKNNDGKVPIPDNEWGKIKTCNPIPFAEQQQYKYILDIGHNAEWSERLRKMYSCNSVVVKHESKAQEFFDPIPKPWVHYIPIGSKLDDMVEKVEWAINHDEQCKEIVYNANEFSKRYLCEQAMYTYALMAIQRYSLLFKAQ